MRKKIIMYWHAGSGNHGCEAIVRSTYQIIGDIYKYVVYSRMPEEDIRYIGDIENNLQFKLGEKKIKKVSLIHLFLFAKKILTKSNSHYYDWIYKPILAEKNTLALSIGGDIYCSKGAPQLMKILNDKLRINNRTVLWGCSIEPNVLENNEVVKELKGYKKIIARESITYNALLNKGLENQTALYPDPAFTLPTVKLPLPNNFAEGKYIGINASPSIENRAKSKDIVYKNYRELIMYILESSQDKIMLIPHVVWKNSNDLDILGKLYKEFKDTQRIYCLHDCNCMQIKGYIARCKLFVGARTHSTIAAYSSCVPTLVVGYSVKSRGIAIDLFGTEENYVVPVQKLSNNDDLLVSYKWLEQNEKEVKKHLEKIMPRYINKAWNAGKEIRKIVES